MNAYSWNSATGQVGMVFNFLFFVFIGIIMLNLVFAVIVDSFGGTPLFKKYLYAFFLFIYH